MELKGKTVLITGGSSGIGLEASKQFLDNGAKVIITGRNQNKLDEVKKIFPNLITIKSDVANAENVKLLLKQVQDLGGIDILYNNAGVMSTPLNLGITNPKHFENAEYEINVNYLGVIRLNNIFMDMLKSKKEGAIINTASILSYVPGTLVPTYSASKAAMRSYTDSLRKHLQILNSQVKVFELSPPLVATDMADSFEMKAISPEVLVKALISGIKKDNFIIRVGNTKIIYFLNKIFPKLAFNLVNSNSNIKRN